MRELVANQNTVTFINLCCHQMREGILPPQSSNKNIESLKVSMLFTEFILRLGSKVAYQLVASSVVLSLSFSVINVGFIWLHPLTLSFLAERKPFYLCGAKDSFIPNIWKEKKASWRTMFHIQWCALRVQHRALDGGTANSWESLHLGIGGESKNSVRVEKGHIHVFF